jgi:hypothetical protein
MLCWKSPFLCALVGLPETYGFFPSSEKLQSRIKTRKHIIISKMDDEPKKKVDLLKSEKVDLLSKVVAV